MKLNMTSILRLALIAPAVLGLPGLSPLLGASNPADRVPGRYLVKIDPHHARQVVEKHLRSARHSGSDETPPVRLGSLLANAKLNSLCRRDSTRSVLTAVPSSYYLDFNL